MSFFYLNSHVAHDVLLIVVTWYWLSFYSETSNLSNNIFIECTDQPHFSSKCKFLENYCIRITADKSIILITLSKDTVNSIDIIVHMLYSEITHFSHSFNLALKNSTCNNLFMHVSLVILQETSYLFHLLLGISQIKLLEQ